MTDKELLEYAAKAAEYDELQFDSRIDGMTDYEGWVWNPLTNDGDALRLAVKLDIDFGGFYDGCAVALTGFILEPIDNNPCAATRRAIVRAAAEIGKGIK